MKEVRLPLSQEEYDKLAALARDLGVAPEELARLGLEDLLGQPDDAVREAMAFVLAKNKDLYRRLA